MTAAPAAFVAVRLVAYVVRGPERVVVLRSTVACTVVTTVGAACRRRTRRG